MMSLLCRSIGKSAQTAALDTVRVTGTTAIFMGSYYLYDKLSQNYNGFFSNPTPKTNSQKKTPEKHTTPQI